MKILMGLILVVILAAAGASALHLKIADGAVAAVFPQEQTQRAALNQCEQQSPKFDRLDPAARDTCYRGLSAPIAQPGLPTNTAQPSNQVDLRAAAARGSAPGQVPSIIPPFHR
jgi:hypothetical protein